MLAGTILLLIYSETTELHVLALDFTANVSIFLLDHPNDWQIFIYADGFTFYF